MMMVRMETQTTQGQKIESNDRTMLVLTFGSSVINNFIRKDERLFETFGRRLLLVDRDFNEQLMEFTGTYHLMDTTILADYYFQERHELLVNAYHSSRIIRHQRISEFKELVELIGAQR